MNTLPPPKFQSGDRVIVALKGRQTVANVGQRHSGRWEAKGYDGAGEPVYGLVDNHVIEPRDALGFYWVDINDGQRDLNGRRFAPLRVMYHEREIMAFPTAD